MIWAITLKVAVIVMVTKWPQKSYFFEDRMNFWGKTVQNLLKSTLSNFSNSSFVNILFDQILAICLQKVHFQHFLNPKMNFLRQNLTVPITITATFRIGYSLGNEAGLGPNLYTIYSKFINYRHDAQLYFWPQKFILALKKCKKWTFWT